MYIFTDWDDIKGVEYDISGQDFRNLVEVCFSKCAFVSFKKNNGSNAIPQKAVPRDGLTLKNPKAVAYQCTNTLKEYILAHQKAMFDWTVLSENSDRLEDMTFCRKDGSIFFWSETHEGICALLPNGSDEVASIVNRDGWVKSVSVNGAGFYGIPSYLFGDED